MKLLLTFGRCLTIAAVVALLVGPIPAAAFELTVQTANDPISGNSHPDDFYTAALAFDVAFAAHRWTLGERMFTDRERTLRFDETFLEMTRPLPEWHGWHSEVTAGVVHVGQGLFGEEVQNEIHRWVGSDPVELPYVQESRWYATGRVRLERPLALAERGTVLTRFEAAAAPGFQQSLRAQLLGDLRLGGDVVLRAGVGARAGKAESDLLGDRIDDLGPTWELGVAWRDWALRYAFNDDGTESQHLSLAVKLGASRGRRAGEE